MLVETGLVVLIVLVVAQAVWLAIMWRQLRQQRIQLTQLLLATASDVPTSMLVMAQARIERRLESLLQQRDGSYAQSAPVAASDSFGLAQQLARQGVAVDELMARCGLSRGEAELVRRMQEIVA
ncbi:DUF2802 domain-containing protein [Dyella tabacisoli]|uniref:DUF2802 domain-containing protein n=1 Tax=Dyella tabacisoli TaxID=2282381 RepID=A0A369UGI9_9GAMM|nr:DUF2802 domain-containing protein [Dyella tabacisoli]RDD79844.1 DUF2802 domain-containing protein [Dyella tabacisoli]